jgi:hypothetical protein
MEAGDRIFVTCLGPRPEEIQATLNFSQWLTEAFHQNSTLKSFCDIVLTHCHDFEDMFAKESFDALPEQKIWDHAIELVPDAKHSNCKIYPLSMDEQTQLDNFIEESLTSGQIWPSKSLMASPCFFIKKKDGSLCLVQDYWALNSITIKNRYPLPLISELIGQLCRARYFTKLQ